MNDWNRFHQSKKAARGAGIHWVQRTDGAAVIEYALTLAVVVAGTIGACLAVGTGAKRLFRETSLQIDSDGVAEASPGVRSSHQDVAAGARSTGGASESASAVGTTDRRWIGWLTLLAGLSAGTVFLSHTLWQLRRRSRPKSSSDTDDAAPTPRQMLERLLAKRHQVRRLLLRRMGRSSALRTQVQDLMSTELVSITPKARLTDVARLMADRRIRHLLVCHNNGPLLGIISDRDIRHRGGATADAIMTPQPITVSPEAPVAPAITQMICKGISCLPVVGPEGNICGVLTTTDLMLSLQSALLVFEEKASRLPPSENALEDVHTEQLEPLLPCSGAADQEPTMPAGGH